MAPRNFILTMGKSVLNLSGNYRKCELDRRAFLKKLAVYTGSMAGAMKLTPVPEKNEEMALK